MSLIGTAIGALVALLPRPSLDKADARFIAGYDAGLKDGRREAQEAQVEVERLTRSHARLVDHIETLEREILLEQHICRHWKEEAARLARQSREERERREAQAQQALQQQSQNPLPTPRWAEMNGRSAMAYAQAQQNLGNQQAQLAQYAGQAQGLQGAFDGFCNCVPSRAQVWGARREG
jgi:chromosome segregation ATPase